MAADRKRHRGKWRGISEWRRREMALMRAEGKRRTEDFNSTRTRAAIWKNVPGLEIKTSVGKSDPPGDCVRQIGPTVEFKSPVLSKIVNMQ